MGSLRAKQGLSTALDEANTYIYIASDAQPHNDRTSNSVVAKLAQGRPAVDSPLSLTRPLCVPCSRPSQSFSSECLQRQHTHPTLQGEQGRPAFYVAITLFEGSLPFDQLSYLGCWGLRFWRERLRVGGSESHRNWSWTSLGWRSLSGDVACQAGARYSQRAQQRDRRQVTNYS